MAASATLRSRVADLTQVDTLHFCFTEQQRYSHLSTNLARFQSSCIRGQVSIERRFRASLYFTVAGIRLK